MHKEKERERERDLQQITDATIYSAFDLAETILPLALVYLSHTDTKAFHHSVISKVRMMCLITSLKITSSTKSTIVSSDGEQMIYCSV